MAGGEGDAVERLKGRRGDRGNGRMGEKEIFTFLTLSLRTTIFVKSHSGNLSL
jgi:hypothetical protein